MLVKIRCGMWEMKEKTCGCGIFVQRNVWEAPFNTPTKTVAEFESLALKMGKIVKDDTGSGRWEVG